HVVIEASFAPEESSILEARHRLPDPELAHQRLLLVGGAHRRSPRRPPPGSIRLPIRRAKRFSSRVLTDWCPASELTLNVGGCRAAAGPGRQGRRTRPLHLVADPARRWNPAATGQRTRAAWSGAPCRPGPAECTKPNGRSRGKEPSPGRGELLRPHDDPLSLLGLLELGEVVAVVVGTVEAQSPQHRVDLVLPKPLGQHLVVEAPGGRDRGLDHLPGRERAG